MYNNHNARFNFFAVLMIKIYKLLSNCDGYAMLTVDKSDQRYVISHFCTCKSLNNWPWWLSHRALEIKIHFSELRFGYLPASINTCLCVYVCAFVRSCACMSVSECVYLSVCFSFCLFKKTRWQNAYFRVWSITRVLGECYKFTKNQTSNDFRLDSIGHEMLVKPQLLVHILERN